MNPCECQSEHGLMLRTLRTGHGGYELLGADASRRGRGAEERSEDGGEMAAHAGGRG